MLAPGVTICFSQVALEGTISQAFFSYMAKSRRDASIPELQEARHAALLVVGMHSLFCPDLLAPPRTSLGRGLAVVVGVMVGVVIAGASSQWRRFCRASMRRERLAALR